MTCSCYQYESQGFGWQRNREECQKSGGDLVATETEEEWEFVKNKIQMKSTSGSDEWYIGLYRNASTGNWTWVSGEPLTLQKWQPNKPYDDSSKNAAVITKSFPAGTHGLFKNVNGNTKYWAYICEVTRTSEYSDLHSEKKGIHLLFRAWYNRALVIDTAGASCSFLL